jgi:aminomethyltransferase
MSDLKHTPLERAHQALGARLVPFAGWYMPVQYASIIAEHSAVRSKAGIFDISHMGQFLVSGPTAETWLNGLLTNNIARLAPGHGQYSLMLNETGGVIDDLIAYRTGETTYFLVVNASMIEADFFWLTAHQDEQITLRNESDLWAGMAIQGPLAAQIFATVFPCEPLPPRNGIHSTASGSIVCRTGYTGEDGFEFFCPEADGISNWEKFIAAGAAPCGLGARDTLRLEMGYPLNGSDLSPDRSPIEAGLGFFCDLDKGDFIGRDTLARQKTAGPSVKLTAIQFTGNNPLFPALRSGHRLFQRPSPEKQFPSSKCQNPPGHEGIEIGLCKLYRATGERKYLDLAKFLIDVRGRPETHKLYGAHYQDHQPVVAQDEAVGHAVRAAYLYSGMADVAALTGDESYLSAIDRIWENVVFKRLYLTGGIGASRGGEAFGKNYELPNKTAYTPFFPPSGPATGFSNGPHPKSNFLAVIPSSSSVSHFSNWFSPPPAIRVAATATPGQPRSSDRLRPGTPVDPG